MSNHSIEVHKDLISIVE